jgi:oxygen-dependent protoporphyrinogen oxidase
VVVVGGGIGGLTAARELAAAGADVLVLEGAPRTGGKLRRTPVGGVSVDVGAEAMLNRRPEGVALARSLDLAVEHPTTASSRIWTRGALRPLPRSLMGVPLDLDQLARSGVLSEEGLVAARLGDEVVDRLVEPLLGGVYAGRARELSARATVPQLVALLERGPLLDAAVPVSDVPVFAGLRGGMAGLADALVGAGGFAVRTGATVRELRRVPDAEGGSRFALTIGSAARPELVEADAVVLATPAAPTARLLAGLAPGAAAELAAIEYASMAVVTLAFRAAELTSTSAFDGGSSGFLVPPVDGRRIKAATFSFAKWGWVREAGRGALDGEDALLLRTSLGRHREEAALQATDEELVAASLADLATATGSSARPVDTHVQRWGGGLPQYAVGHLDRVARIRADVARIPGLAVCGAAYDGVGIPAVIASARRAVARITGAE